MIVEKRIMVTDPIIPLIIPIIPYIKLADTINVGSLIMSEIGSLYKALVI